MLSAFSNCAKLNSTTLYGLSSISSFRAPVRAPSGPPELLERSLEERKRLTPTVLTRLCPHSFFVDTT
jgi:hypothetical protein